MIVKKAKLILWGGRFLGVVTLVAAIWFAGLNFGMDRGYKKALNESEMALSEYNKQWHETVSDRDEEWRAQVDILYTESQQQLENYRQREQELLAQLTALESTPCSH